MDGGYFTASSGEFAWPSSRCASSAASGLRSCRAAFSAGEGHDRHDRPREEGVTLRKIFTKKVL
jgi:hypothetical protein